MYMTLRVDREHVGNTLTASTGRQVRAFICFCVCLFVSMGAYLKNRYREQHLLFPKKKGDTSLCPSSSATAAVDI